MGVVQSPRLHCDITVAPWLTFAKLHSDGLLGLLWLLGLQAHHEQGLILGGGGEAPHLHAGLEGVVVPLKEVLLALGMDPRQFENLLH